MKPVSRLYRLLLFRMALRHVGRRARAPILMHRPCHRFKASGGMWDASQSWSFSSFTVVVGLQTTRIKGIMPKGLEVELELLGVKGTVK